MTLAPIEKTNSPSQGLGGHPVSTPKSAAREVDCPRCCETCGWCGDYRWMHGKLALPGGSGSRRYCTIAAMAPDASCAVCGGSRRVLATTTFAPLQDAATPADGPNGHTGIGSGLTSNLSDGVQ